jgi:hypothetical protein
VTSTLELLLERARLVGTDLDEDVPSPCVSVCRMDAAMQLCEGCRRTLDEIAAWSRMTNEEKRGVWALIVQRVEESRA